MNLDPRIEQFAEQQKLKGGLNMTLLEPGTKLTVETRNSIYQLKIIEGRAVTIMGGMTRGGEIRFPKPVPAVLVGATWGGSMLKPDWIGQDMRMEIGLPEDPLRVLTTTEVQNVEVESADGKWAYSMDWNKD